MSETTIAKTNQYLTFILCNEQYALEIAKVREVLDCSTITQVPRMPAFLRGVINLRGNVVPVVDLRLSLGLPAIEQTKDTCIVIVEVNIDNETLPVGMLTDAVEEVIDIDTAQIKPPAHLGNKLPTEFIDGMGMRDEGFIIILNIDRVLSAQTLGILDTARNTADGE